MSGFAYLTQMCLLITVGMMTNSLCTIVWRPVSLRNKDRRVFITRSTNKFFILLFLNIASWNSSCEKVCMSKWACQMLQIRKPHVEVQKLLRLLERQSEFRCHIRLKYLTWASMCRDWSDQHTEQHILPPICFIFVLQQILPHLLMSWTSMKSCGFGSTCNWI